MLHQSTSSAFCWPSNAVFPSIPAVLRPALICATRRTLTSVLERDRSISFCRFLTLARSPACDAVKIRCRKRRTLPSAESQSTRDQSKSSPSGPFAAPLSGAVSNLPFGSSAIVISLSTGSPDPRQHPFGSQQRLVSGQLYAATGGRADLFATLSCCLSAAGIRFSGHPSPAEEFGLPHGRPTERFRTSTGLSRSARASCDRIGRPLQPRDGGALLAASPLWPAPAASQRPVLLTPLRHSICGA
jgi:hypothetical protein